MDVLVADDHALVRHGLISLIRDVHPEWRLSEASSLDEALDVLSRQEVGLALLDLKMPGMDAGASLAALREMYPNMLIAVLTGNDDRDVILACLSAGVHGYILKSDAPEQLLSALDLILSGHIYVPAALTRVVRNAAAGLIAEGAVPGAGSEISGEAPPKAFGASHLPSLTGRQRDVLQLLAEGRPTKDIARRLNLSIGTVKVHLAGVYRALGASNRMEAIVRAGQIKWKG